jgi:putative transposase
MARPGRNASPDEILRPDRIFFTTTKTFMGKRLLQSERNANLLIEVLRSLVKENSFELHDFVVMPDHVHLLLTVHGDTTVEKAMQLIKGRFSYRLSHEFGHKADVWQRGFSEVQVLGKQSFEQHRVCIAENPIEAGLERAGEEYPYCYRTLANRKAAGAEAQELIGT